MSDDKTKSGVPDSKRINIHEPYELRYWSKKLNVLPEALKLAVDKVGTSVESVEKFFKK